MSARDRPGYGISLRILSGVLMAGMYICVKALSEAVPLGQIVFFRSAFAIPPLLLYLWLCGALPAGLGTQRPVAHFLRASVGALALFASFAALARLNLAEAILIAQLAPVLMAVAAVLLLSERLTRWRVGGLALGFVGVVVLVWPELNVEAPANARLGGYLLALLAAALTALALILVRDLNRTEHPGAIALYFVLASLLGALLTLPFGWVMPDGTTLALLMLAGLFGGCAHIAMTLAFRYAEASRLAPFEYLALLWPLLADLLLFRVEVSAAFMLAAPLILLGAGFAALEARRAR